MDYFDDQGVQIISRSLTSPYDGPGNGTGPMANVVNSATADGMVWFNAAGNNASDGFTDIGLGSYWRGPWNDSNGNGSLNFAPGDDFLGFACGSVNGIRWNDFGEAVPTDYDIYVYDEPTSLLPFYSSGNFQGSGGLDPIEMVDFQCLPGDVDYLDIRLYAAGGGTSGDTVEFMANQGAFEYWQNPYSASGPASDTNSAGALSVGAIVPATAPHCPYSS